MGSISSEQSNVPQHPCRIVTKCLFYPCPWSSKYKKFKKFEYLCVMKKFQSETKIQMPDDIIQLVYQFYPAMEPVMGRVAISCSDPRNEWKKTPYCNSYEEWVAYRIYLQIKDDFQKIFHAPYTTT